MVNDSYLEWENNCLQFLRDELWKEVGIDIVYFELLKAGGKSSF